MSDNKELIGFPDNKLLDKSSTELHNFASRYLESRYLFNNEKTRKIIRDEILKLKGQITHKEAKKHLDFTFRESLYLSGYMKK